MIPRAAMIVISKVDWNVELQLIIWSMRRTLKAQPEDSESNFSVDMPVLEAHWQARRRQKQLFSQAGYDVHTVLRTNN